MDPYSEAASWDQIAEGYASVIMPFFRGYSEAALRITGVGPEDHIADIACGPGTLALTASPRVARVSALDFSSEMVALLDREAAQAGVDNVTAAQGDGQNMPYGAATFDAAFSMFGLIFFPDRARGFAELCRVTKPGGAVCVASWAPAAESPLMSAMFGAMRTISPNIPEPEADATSLENPEVLHAEMAASGLRDVVVHTVQDSAEIASARAFWDGMGVGAAPVVMMRNALGETQWEERSRGAVAHLEKALGPFPKTLAATAYLGVGRTP